MGKKINAKEVLQDIREGMLDNALMYKYELTPSQLKQLYAKMEKAGLLDKQGSQASAEQASGHISPPAPPLIPLPEYTCPACDQTHTSAVEECARCGIIMSKYASAEAEPEPEGHYGSKPVEVPEIVGSQAVQPKSGFLKVVLVLVAVLIVVLGLVYFRGGEDSAPVDMSEVGEESEDGARSGSEGTKGRYTDMIKRKLPRLAPINEDLDEHVRDEFGEIGKALDKRDEFRDNMNR